MPSLFLDTRWKQGRVLNKQGPNPAMISSSNNSWSTGCPALYKALDGEEQMGRPYGIHGGD